MKHNVNSKFYVVIVCRVYYGAARFNANTTGVVETTTPVPFLHFSTFRKQYASLYVLAIIFQWYYKYDILSM